MLAAETTPSRVHKLSPKNPVKLQTKQPIYNQLDIRAH